MLRPHPQIFMPELKETRFFAPEQHPRSRDPRSPESEMYPGSLEEYRSLFDGAERHQRVGEATPSYLVSLTAAELIASERPDARIIAILREPASFVHSFYLQRARNRSESNLDFAKAMALEEEWRPDQEVRSQARFVYSEGVRYVEQLRRYEEAFSPQQILVIVYCLESLVRLEWVLDLVDAKSDSG